tara:strand:+ start:992 stop:1225 length:234 start_codon:yes stop_codon:yes gene_type:complete
MMRDRCIGCARDTSFGSGLFVNRIPADNDEKYGYLCPDCQSMDCDHCHESALNWGSDKRGGIICDDCAEKDTGLHAG